GVADRVGGAGGAADVHAFVSVLVAPRPEVVEVGHRAGPLTPVPGERLALLGRAGDRRRRRVRGRRRARRRPRAGEDAEGDEQCERRTATDQRSEERQAFPGGTRHLSPPYESQRGPGCWKGVRATTCRSPSR